MKEYKILQRPTCITVIGWLWIIIGIYMAVGGLMISLFYYSSFRPAMSTGSSEVPLFIKLFPLIIVIQVNVGALAFVAGRNFLKLRPWARTTLEVLSWLGLTYVIGVLIIWIYQWLSINSESNMGIVGCLMAVFITGVFSVPLIIIIRTLRGNVVKTAIEESQKMNESVESQEEMNK